MTIASLRQFANQILREKDDHTPVGANWHLNFLKRHPELRTALSRPIDKQCVMGENPDLALKSLVQWQRATIAVLNQQVQVFESVRANHKPRTKRKVKGSAKVYSKGEVDALKAAEAEQQRIKDVQLAQRVLKRLEAANKKAQRKQERQKRAVKAAESGQTANRGQRGSKRQTQAPTLTPVVRELIKTTRAAANYQLSINVDALE